jgi:hypothetical protein
MEAAAPHQGWLWRRSAVRRQGVRHVAEHGVAQGDEAGIREGEDVSEDIVNWLRRQLNQPVKPRQMLTWVIRDERDTIK